MYPSSIVKTLLSRTAPTICSTARRTKYYSNRHRDPLYRKERSEKVWAIDLPDFDEIRKDVSIEEKRSRMKEKGIARPMIWNERTMYQPSSVTILDQYNPNKQDSDGITSSLTSKIKGVGTTTKSFIASRRSLNQIKEYEGEEFSLEQFAKTSIDVYKRAHELLSKGDNKEIFDYVTEFCYPIMTNGIKRNTIIWKYIDEVEPPKVVQVRNAKVHDSNIYGQITVKLNTKQIVAIFDRHGRLISGSPVDVRQVTEHVVYEKFLSNEYGLWRLHGKINSNTMLAVSKRTFRTWAIVYSQASVEATKIDSATSNPVPPTEPAHIKEIVTQIANLKFHEVVMLNDALKRELKIPDFAIAAAGAPTAGATTEQEEETKTKTSFTVKLVKFQDTKKVALIKEIKKLITGINLVEAKRFVEDCPKILKSNATKSEAEDLKKKIEEAGGEVSID